MTKDRRLLIWLGIGVAVALAAVAFVNLRQDAEMRRLRAEAGMSAAELQAAIDSMNAQVAQWKSEREERAYEDARTTYAGVIVTRCQTQGGSWDRCAALARSVVDGHLPKR